MILLLKQIALAIFATMVSMLVVGLLIYGWMCEEKSIDDFANDPRTEAVFKRIDSLLVTDKEKYKIKLDVIKRVKRQEKQEH